MKAILIIFATLLLMGCNEAETETEELSTTKTMIEAEETEETDYNTIFPGTKWEGEYTTKNFAVVKETLDFDDSKVIIKRKSKTYDYENTYNYVFMDSILLLDGEEKFTIVGYTEEEIVVTGQNIKKYERR